jgi:hypothetical protein
MVYLGIESGNEEGLQALNKNISVEQNISAVRVLKSLGLRYDFGFMLFDPSSTIETVLENIRFLRKICGDGSATASFGKTLPYSGTELAFAGKNACAAIRGRRITGFLMNARRPGSPICVRCSTPGCMAANPCKPN